jgi:hypothetical protein
MTARALTRPKAFGLCSILACLGVLATSAPVKGSITIGQVDPSPVAVCTNSPFDHIMEAVGSGNSYVVPYPGTVTSWSHNAAAGSGQQLTMKVFRQVSGNAWTVVGHDGPRPLTPSSLNTFPASIPVRAGDVLGLNDANALSNPNACSFDEPGMGDSLLERGGDLADGDQGTFNGPYDSRSNVTAQLDPTNTFSVGQAVRNKKKGTALLTVELPNPGDLAAAGKGAKVTIGAAPATAVSAGQLTLKVKAKGKKRRTLEATGKVKVRLSITFTPTGGSPRSEQIKVKLKKT